MVRAVLELAEREIGLARRELGAVEQHALGAARARRAHDARMLGAGRIFLPIGIRAVGQRNAGRVWLDAAFQLLEEPARASGASGASTALA